jgi:RNA polymerase sigma factor (sigma-70 family)
MSHDTDIGGTRRSFPTTQRSVVEAIASSDPEVRRAAFGELVAGYWKPVYCHIRIRWHACNEDAKDLTQEFFTHAMTADYFTAYDPRQSRFRTFLRVCLDRFLANAARDAERLKRGGGADIVGLDFEAAEAELRVSAPEFESDPESRFQREWIRNLLTLSVEDLRRHCEAAGKGVQFQLFERHDLFPAEGGARPGYKDLAREFELPVTQVTNFLAYARREFRRLTLERLRVQCGSDEEFRAEARELLGAEPP